MAVCDTVIVGSYPPMPGRATAATLAAVRREWDAGWTVRVVSFRPGAADISVAVAGPLAGWRVEQVRRHYGGPPHLALVLQQGAPFYSRGYPEQLATTLGLLAAFRRFERVTLVVGEDPGVLGPCFRALTRAVSEVVVAGEVPNLSPTQASHQVPSPSWLAFTGRGPPAASRLSRCRRRLSPSGPFPGCPSRAGCGPCWRA
jgi:hypothetical protein